MILTKATDFGEEYHYCRTCKKELKELETLKFVPTRSNPVSGRAHKWDPQYDICISCGLHMSLYAESGGILECDHEPVSTGVVNNVVIKPSGLAPIKPTVSGGHWWLIYPNGGLGKYCALCNADSLSPGSGNPCPSVLTSAAPKVKDTHTLVTNRAGFQFCTKCGTGTLSGPLGKDCTG